MRRIFLILLFFITFIAITNVHASYAQEKKVLLISSYHPGFPTFFQQISGLKSVLDPQNILLDVEFMDSKRFYNQKNLDYFFEYLKFKMHLEHPYDVIVTADDNALKFVLHKRPDLFEHNPIVFMGLNNNKLAEVLDDNPDYTGVIESVSAVETIELAKNLFPKAENLYVIVDSTPSGQADLMNLRKLKSKTKDILIHELSLHNMSWIDLRNKLKGLSKKDVILLLSAYRDMNNISKTFDDSLQFITAYTDVPIFHLYEHGVGNGLLGGKVVSHFQQGKIAGEMALDILSGIPAGHIPVVSGSDANTYLFDRNILDKYNISSSDIPEESLILNDRQSVFETYKFEMISLSIFISILSFFSIALLFSYIRLKNAEDKVRESEKRFALAMQANKDGIWDWNILTDEVYYSPGYTAMIGYDSEEVPCNVDSWLDFIHEDDREHTFKANSDCILNKIDNFEVEFRMQHKDGSWRWILGRGNAVGRDESGKAYRMIGTHTDITERKESEVEIKNLRNYLKNILDSMPFVIIGIDAHANVTLWNSKTAQVTGLSALAAAGKPVVDVFPQLSSQADKIHEALNEHKIYFDPRLIRRQGPDVFYEELTIYPLETNNGNGSVIIVEDVTERVQLEEMIIQNEKMLSVGGLAAGMAHEINNPLGVILQGSQNLMRRVSADLKENRKTAERIGITIDDLQEYFEERKIVKVVDGIHSAAVGAAKIVSNMLSFSRKNGDDFTFHELSEVIDETIELASNEYNLITQYDFKKINIVKNYDADVPPVYCERSEIKQVILNLLKNGAQSMSLKNYETGGPQFDIFIKWEPSRAIVEIKDNGQGMDLEIRKRIFEPFYTTRQANEGTGLGLAISYFIITALHKGQMEVHSVPGEWTSFIFSLPLQSDAFK